jgi:hypothetical protein
MLNPNPTITNLDLGGPVIVGRAFMDGLLTFAGAATVLEGTILARDSVSGKFVPYVIGGVTNENGIPKAVIRFEVTAAGAGDEPVRVLIDGEVDRNRLVVDADGDASNITDAILDELRDYGIVSRDVKQLSALDNQ